jgi:hypothetical protein
LAVANGRAKVTGGGFALWAEVRAQPETEIEELVQLTGRLGDELLDLYVDSVQLAARDEAADDSKRDSFEVTGVSSAERDRLIELSVMRRGGAG